jgi:hypothetical protein
MEENHTSGNIRQISWKDTNGTPFEIIKKAQFITRLTIGRMYSPVEELSNFVNLEELIFGDQYFFLFFFFVNKIRLYIYVK